MFALKICRSYDAISTFPAPTIGAMRSSRVAAEAIAESRKSVILLTEGQKEAPKVVICALISSCDESLRSNAPLSQAISLLMGAQ